MKESGPRGATVEILKNSFDVVVVGALIWRLLGLFFPTCPGTSSISATKKLDFALPAYLYGRAKNNDL
jgi:hypothetical protein